MLRKKPDRGGRGGEGTEEQVDVRRAGVRAVKSAVVGGWLPVDHPHLTASLLQPYPGPMGAQPVSYLDHDSGQDTEAVEALD